MSLHALEMCLGLLAPYFRAAHCSLVRDFTCRGLGFFIFKMGLRRPASRGYPNTWCVTYQKCGMGPCYLFWGGSSSAQIATLGIPQDLTPKLAGHNTGRGYSERGAETRQGSPAERASGSCLWGPVWASAHELDWSWFFFTSSSKACSGILPKPPPSAAVTATSPRVLGG